ncbi:PHP domain-containing protein [Mumia zhuanghuii]|uniref:PHP domain-containing protein n=1 Tax=Mumia zhuanghuii TaxID=2585211 RepID=A0A5C4MU15_9ACTN|nr:PHP domain-containing protein [Mumia zhuanghuii]TNC49397.1 PHP domain-containing protein [Mumia zhuanghuii]TNC49487.1 PHP domain-containing protein [Mumia zhuanghuii]
MLIDLHTHSRRSDGTDSPTELVENAARAGLDVVALTDHDAMTGWDEAQRAADRVGITLVKGLEISCRYRHKGVHLLGYEPDPTDPSLLGELERVLRGRQDRLPRTIAKLNDLGIAITEADVLAVSGDAAATGRPHVADALIVRGVVASRDEAFERYLMPGRPAYVDRYAADLEEMIRLLVDAGGRPVIAHPWTRQSRSVLTEEVIAGLAELGLVGLEVDHNDHDADSRAALRAIAHDLDLAVTGSSDYHGTGKVGYDLGVNTTAPDQAVRLLGERLDLLR